MIAVGSTIVIRGASHRVVCIGPAGQGKFFGRRKFLLQARDSSLHEAFGKTVGHNSNTCPPNMEQWERYGYKPCGDTTS